VAEIGVVVALDLVAWRYLVGVHRAWAVAGTGRLVRWIEVARFVLGLLTVAAALLSPLDGAAGTSLTAHMVQHVLLLCVAPPLLVLGAPVPALLWSLPDRGRTAGRRVWRRVVRSRRGAGWLWWMAAALGVQTVAMWAWHAPLLYDAAVRHEAVHVAEHLTYVGAGCLFWWTVTAGPHRRHGAAALGVIIGALPGTALGAALTFASRPWYPPYPSLSDQQMAGVVMWAFAGTAYIVAAGVLIGAWMVSLDREDERLPVGVPGIAGTGR
jgi:putative membrane protein